jgi:MFS family permease
MEKPTRNFWQIWNMSFGFLGIQFGWGLQMANMSAIYEYLGARADQIPILWLAAPLTGLVLPSIAERLGRKNTHSLCLLCGATGLLSVGIIHNQWLLLLSMIGVGFAWASTLSMPYAVLAGSLPPEKTGVYMGIFNFFIVIPEILASLFFGWVMNHLLNNNRILAVGAGGVFMIAAAMLMQRVHDPGEEKVRMAERSPLGAIPVK